MKDHHRFLGLFTIFVMMAAAMVGGLSCEDEDDESPAAIWDMEYFYDADAVGFNGFVVGGSQSEPANTRVLAWTSPGDNGYDGEAASYDFRYARSSDFAAGSDPAAWLAANFDDARRLVNEPYPKEGGRLQQLLLPRLTLGDNIWVAARTLDEIGQESGVGGVVGPIELKRLRVPARSNFGTLTNNLGSDLAALGDIDNDGYADFAAASPDEGKVHFYPGRIPELLINQATLNANGLPIHRSATEMNPNYSIIGSVAEEFGALVEGIGLTNGDNYSDMAIGAPSYDSGLTTDLGRVYIDFGSYIQPGSTLSSAAMDLVITGVEPNGRFGSAIAALFDIDVDNYGEYLVAAPGASGGRGNVYLFRGQLQIFGSQTAERATTVFVGEQANSGFGDVVSVIGDVNGDGIQDFAISAPDYDWGATATDGGAVYIFYGSAGSATGGTIDLAVDKADVTIKGTVSGGRFGRAIASCGNLAGNFDTNTDFAVAGVDAVYIYFGGGDGTVSFPLVSTKGSDVSTNANATLALAGEDFGAALAGPGDLDFDAVSELIVGAPGADKCYLFKGPFTASSDASDVSEIIGGDAGSGFCSDVKGVGDFNYDGYSDIVIGSPRGGEAYLYF